MSRPIKLLGRGGSDPPADTTRSMRCLPSSAESSRSCSASVDGALTWNRNKAVPQVSSYIRKGPAIRLAPGSVKQEILRRIGLSSTVVLYRRPHGHHHSNTPRKSLLENKVAGRTLGSGLRVLGHSDLLSMLSVGLMLCFLGSRGDLRPDTNRQLLLRLSLLALAGLTVVRAIWPIPMRPVSFCMNRTRVGFYRV